MCIIFTTIVMFSMLFCLMENSFAREIQIVDNLAELKDLVNSAWGSNSVSRLMPPAKDCIYENSLGIVAYTDNFDTNFIADLVPVVLSDGTNEFMLYPVEVIETNNYYGRIRNYYSAIFTNAIILYSNEVTIADYPISWI